MADIVLIRNYNGCLKNMHPCIGLEFLNTYFLHNKIESQIVQPLYADNRLERYNYEFLDIKKIKELNPKIVGINSLTTQIDATNYCSRMIKKELPDVKIIIGGHASMHYDKLLAEESINAVCVGEGEESSLEYAINILDNNESRVKGIARKEDGKIIFMPRESSLNLNTVPLPDFKEYNLNGVAELSSARGCNGNCSFCESKKMYPHLKYMNAEKVISWIKEIQKYQEVKQAVFMDDNFLADTARFPKIMGFLKQENITTHFLSRADSVLKNKESIIKYAKLLKIDLGIESFSDTQLFRWNKRITSAENNLALSLLSILRIPFNAYIILSDEKTRLSEIEEQIDGIKKAPPAPFDENSFARIPLPLICMHYNTILDDLLNEKIRGISYLEVPQKFLTETDALNRTLMYIFTESNAPEIRDVCIKLSDKRLETFGYGAREIYNGRMGKDGFEEISARYKSLVKKFILDAGKILKHDFVSFLDEIKITLFS
ncbi:B12 binding domain protein [Candidatus Tiddalikarchaeum anstoanum]|nr:B12 binding domain protein [Candidatus Tiddalikarchaeum anstoanum]